MPNFALFALIAWTPLVILAFALVRDKTQAAVWSTLLGWLFLPKAQIVFEGLPELSKTNVTSLSVLFAAALFDGKRFLNIRFSLVDLPILLWISSAFISPVVNGLDAYDGVSAASNEAFAWGIPYLLGRAYIRDSRTAWIAVNALFLAMLLYVPLCAFEIRMSPQLHYWVYGFHPSRFVGLSRAGGFRPIVFLGRPLMLATFMACGLMIGCLYWSTGYWRKIRIPALRTAVPMYLVLPVAAAVVILCKTLGAVVVAVGAFTVAFATLSQQLKWVFILALLTPAVYVATRPPGIITVDILPSREAVIPGNYWNNRINSLRTRLAFEDKLIDKAMQKPLFGWGGHGRSRIYDEKGNDVTITDSLWIIYLGARGVFGLTSLYLTWVLGSLVLLWRVPARYWRSPSMAPFVGLSAIVLVFMGDSMINAMVQSYYIFAMGGIASIAALSREELFPQSAQAPSRPETSLPPPDARQGDPLPHEEEGRYRPSRYGPRPTLSSATPGS